MPFFDIKLYFLNKSCIVWKEVLLYQCVHKK